MKQVNFFLKEPSKDTTLIYAIIRFRGARVVLSTGVKIESKCWNQAKHRSREGRCSEQWEEINCKLDNWETLILGVVGDFELKPDIPTGEQLKTAISNRRKGKEVNSMPLLTDWVEQWIEQSDKRPNTVKSYTTALNILKAYEKHKHSRLTFSSIDMVFYREVRQWMVKKDYRKNYIGSIIKALKTFMEESRDIHHSTAHRDKKFIVEQEKATAVYLSEQELVTIHRMPIDEAAIKKHLPEIYKQRMRLKIASLIDARDRFLIGAFTGLRFSDYSKIKSIDTITGMIEIWTQKTDTRVIIPLHWVIREIIERRGILPSPTSNQKLNKQLKWIGQLAELNDTVSISYTQAGKRVVKNVAKHTVITTHTARRSAATNMYLAGIPTISIMQITGHKTERSFLGYIGVTSQQNADRLKDHPFFTGTIKK